MKELLENENTRYLYGMVTLKFNFFEKFTLLRNNLKWCRKTTKNEEIFDKGQTKIERELDIMVILKQLRKM